MLFPESKISVDTSKTLYGIIPKSEVQNVLQTRFLRGEPGRSYIGLRESIQLAFDRQRMINADVQPEECMVCSVLFSTLGWMHCTTKMMGTIPMLHKKMYKDGLDWGAWHFNAAMPIEIHDERTNDLLLSVTFHALQ